jgi:hypothetical protein
MTRLLQDISFFFGSKTCNFNGTVCTLCTYETCLYNCTCREGEVTQLQLAIAANISGVTGQQIAMQRKVEGSLFEEECCSMQSGEESQDG